MPKQKTTKETIHPQRKHIDDIIADLEKPQEDVPALPPPLLSPEDGTSINSKTPNKTGARSWSQKEKLALWGLKRFTDLSWGEISTRLMKSPKDTQNQWNTIREDSRELEAIKAIIHSEKWNVDEDLLLQILKS